MDKLCFPASDNLTHSEADDLKIAKELKQADITRYKVSLESYLQIIIT